MSEFDWIELFEAVCAPGRGALRWGLPEGWVHAELYAALRNRPFLWQPFPTEVPYVTFYPVTLPKRDWRNEGAVKWVDLCLRKEGGREWCWVELKVRAVGETNRRKEASIDARDAFKKDVVALLGFSAEKTAETWLSPNEYVKAYWFDCLLKPWSEEIRYADSHHFVAAFLQLYGELESAVWNKEIVLEEIQRWFFFRQKESAHKRVFPEIAVTLHKLTTGHSLVLCRWYIKQMIL